MFAPVPIRYGSDGSLQQHDPGLDMVMQSIAMRQQAANQQQAGMMQSGMQRQGSSPTSGQYFTNQNPLAQSVLQAKQAWRNGAGIGDDDLSPAQKQLEGNPNFSFHDYQQTMAPVIQQKTQERKQAGVDKVTATKQKMLEAATQHIHPDLLPDVASQVDDEKTTPNQFSSKVLGAVKETQRRGQQDKEEQAKGQIWQSNIGWMTQHSPDTVDELHALVTDGHTSSAQLLDRIQSVHRGLVKEKTSDLKSFEKEHAGIDFDPSQPPTQLIGPDGKLDTTRAAVYGEWAQKQHDLQQIAHPSGQQQSPPSQVKQIDKQTAQQFYQQAGGDPAKARELAKQAGYSF